MFTKLFLIVTSTVLLVSCGTKLPPKAVYPIPQDKQVRWQQLETYAFIHFGLNTFNDMEWGYGDTPPSTFNPTRLDCEQWVKTCKTAGMKGIIFTAKHHDGFCLWPTKYTDYNITRSPYKKGKGDIVRELADACRKYGLKFAVYLSPWDRNAATYATEAYVKYFHLQLEELLGNYGEVFEVWFDGANGGNGWYGGANETRTIGENYYRFEDAYRLVDKLQPQAIIFSDGGPGCRWVGNERGFAGETNWSFLTQGDIKAGTDKRHTLQHGDPKGDIWVAAECDVSIRPGWFYHENEDGKVKSAEQLADLYYKSVGRNATLLLNFPVNKEGLIHPTDSANAVHFRQIVLQDLKDNLLTRAELRASDTRGRKYIVQNVADGSYDTYWATKDGVRTAHITATWKIPQRINRLLLQEYIALGQRVQAFSIHYLRNGRWEKLTPREETTTIGYKRIIRFDEIETTALRITFEQSRGELCINEMGAYHAQSRASMADFSLAKGKDFEMEGQTETAIAPLSDNNPATVFASQTTTWTFRLKEAQRIGEIEYLPVQNDLTGGFIHSYEVWKQAPGQTAWQKVATGEFSNIRNNPVLQRIVFTPFTAQRIRIVATQVIGEAPIRIAELRIK